MSLASAGTRRVASTPTETLLAEWRLWMTAGAMSERTIGDRVNLVRLLEARTGASAVTCTWQDLAVYFASLVESGERRDPRDVLQPPEAVVRLAGRF